MKTRNKIFLVIFCIIFSLLLAACGGNNAPEDDTALDEEPSIESEETTAEVGASAESETKEESTSDPCLASHELYEMEAAIAVSCTETGKTAKLACKNCSYTEGGETVAALGHDKVHHEAKAASCTEAGWNAYDTCKRCDYIDREIIGKLAHEYTKNNKCACGEKKWTAPIGTTMHYASDLSGATPSIDGVISAGEYGNAVRVESARKINLDSRAWLSGTAEKELFSQYMDFYFSYDEENVYIAVYDAGPEYIEDGDGYGENNIPYRYNYLFEFGFDLKNSKTFFIFDGGSTSSAWPTLYCYRDGSYEKLSIKSYDLINDSIIHKLKVDENGNLGESVSYGDIGSVNGNKNYKDSAWAVVMEFKLNKSELIKLINDTYGTEYEELSNAMWFSASAKTFKAKANDLGDTLPEQSARWVGQTVHFVDLVVFGDENTDISPADPYPTQDFCPDGHLLTSHKAKAPTYDEVGYEAYKTCDTCKYTTYKELPKLEKTFLTGYSRVDITPDVSEENPLGQFTDVMDDLYATCVAVSDGENTILILSIDMKSMSASVCDGVRARISKVTGIPTDQIFISATHTHSVIEFVNDDKWAIESFRKIGEAAKDAIADLEDTEMYIGTGKTTGMAWVRRYIDDNGKIASVHPYDFWNTTTRSVSEADDTVQAVRMVREGKKDIVLINWQCHLAQAVDIFKSSISADMAHYIREGVESGDDDALVAFFAGASGNLNTNAPNLSLAKYINNSNPKTYNNYYANIAKDLAKIILDVIKDENLTKIESGRIVFEKRNFDAMHKRDSAEEIAAAQARLDAGGTDPADGYMVERNKSVSTTLRISAVAFGDFAFVTVPYEMFDNNGAQVKEVSPFKMTFVLTNSDGDYAYMPSYEACTEYGGYETKATYFDTGVAEQVVNQYKLMLNNLYKSKK